MTPPYHLSSASTVFSRYMRLPVIFSFCSRAKSDTARVDSVLCLMLLLQYLFTSFRCLLAAALTSAIHLSICWLSSCPLVLMEMESRSLTELTTVLSLYSSSWMVYWCFSFSARLVAVYVSWSCFILYVKSLMNFY